MLLTVWDSAVVLCVYSVEFMLFATCLRFGASGAQP